MAGRSLENLVKRYGGIGSKPQAAKGPMPGPKHGPGHGPGHGPATGNPQDAKRTMMRILSYVAIYWKRMVGALLCMLLSTAASLAGSYILRPIVNAIADGSTSAADRVAYLLMMAGVLALSLIHI